MCYSFASAHEDKSPEFLIKSINLMDQWYKSLPKSHFENTPAFKKKLEESSKGKMEIVNRWRNGG
jgi:hypothetical protein